MSCNTLASTYYKLFLLSSSFCHQVRAREIDLDNASLTQEVEAQRQALIQLQVKASVRM